MGVFDEVSATCPGCGQVNQLQTKAARDPNFRLHDILDRDLPLEIAADLQGRHSCQSCGNTFTIVVQMLVSVV